MPVARTLLLLLVLPLAAEASQFRARRAPPPHRTTPTHLEQQAAMKELDPPDTYRPWVIRHPSFPGVGIPQWLYDRPGIAGLSRRFGNAPIDPFGYSHTEMLLRRLGVTNYWDLDRFMRATDHFAGPQTRDRSTRFYDMVDIHELVKERFWYESHGYLQPDELIRYKIGWTPPDMESSGPRTQWLFDTNLSHIPEQQFKEGATPDDADFFALRAVYNKRVLRSHRIESDDPWDFDSKPTTIHTLETEERLQRSVFYPGGESPSLLRSFVESLVSELMAEEYVGRGKHPADKVAEVVRREFALLDQRRSQFFLYSEQGAHPLDLPGVKSTLRLYDGSPEFADARYQAILGGARSKLPMQHSHEGLVIPNKYAVELGCFTKSRETATPLPLFAEVARELLERHGERDKEGRLTLRMPDDFGVYITALKGKQAEIYKDAPYGFRPATHLKYESQLEEILWLPGQEAVHKFLSIESSSLVPGKLGLKRKDLLRGEKLAAALKIDHWKRTPEQHRLVTNAILGRTDD
jgi:hypothetical protein